jgi:diguanylate cyclase
MLISRDILRSASLHPWSLSFINKRLETLYLHYLMPSVKSQARMGLLLGAVMYGLYGFLDVLFVTPEAVIKVWYVRTMVLMIGFAVFAISFTKKFTRYHQQLIAITGLFAGIGLFAKMSYLPPNAINFYYAGLIIITFWCHTFSGLRFVYATGVSVLLLLIFNMLFWGIRDMPSLDMTSYDFFIISANIIGAFASYMNEKQSRQLFLREKELDNERYLQQERALHDRLTGLPNRELLHDRIEQAIHYASRNSQVCAGLFIDLDKFKPINDTYGHAVGDMVLKEVSARFKNVMREADTLARLGGDEFFVLAKDIQTQEEAEAFAHKLLQQLRIPLTSINAFNSNSVSASIGICMFPYPHATAIDVVRRADQAMYHVKRMSKDGIAVAAID